MSDLVENHIVGFPTRRLIFSIHFTERSLSGAVVVSIARGLRLDPGLL